MTILTIAGRSSGVNAYVEEFLRRHSLSDEIHLNITGRDALWATLKMAALHMQSGLCRLVFMPRHTISCR